MVCFRHRLNLTNRTINKSICSHSLLRITHIHPNFHSIFRVYLQSVDKSVCGTCHATTQCKNTVTTNLVSLVPLNTKCRSFINHSKRWKAIYFCTHSFQLFSEVKRVIYGFVAVLFIYLFLHRHNQLDNWQHIHHLRFAKIKTNQQIVVVLVIPNEMG